MVANRILKSQLNEKNDVKREDDIELQISTKPIHVEIRRSDLRNRKRVNYNKLTNPKVNKLIKVPLKPHTPEYEGESLNSDIISHWIKCTFNCFDKMHNSGTLSCPFPRIIIFQKVRKPYLLDFRSKLN